MKEDKVVIVYTELLSVSHIDTASQSFDANVYIRLTFDMNDFDETQVPLCLVR
jgi:hypothetical protein